jgi:hypothetical protein
MAAKFIATIEVHDAALQFAREMIFRLHGGDSSFEAPASHSFVRNFMQQGLCTAEGRMILVDAALAGDDDAKAILRDVMLEMKSRHVELPTELGYYDMKIFAGIVPPPGQPGPKRKDKIMSGIAICLVVAAVCDRFSLKPTGHSPRRRSACAIVAQALGVIGMTLSYEAVASIWKMYGRRMHLPRGWVFAMGQLPK